MIINEKQIKTLVDIKDVEDGGAKFVNAQDAEELYNMEFVDVIKNTYVLTAKGRQVLNENYD